MKMRRRKIRRKRREGGGQGLGQSGRVGLGPVSLGQCGQGQVPTCVAALQRPKGLGQVLEVVQAAVVLAVQQDLLGV